MLLSSQTAVHYLLTRGHLDCQSVVDGDVMVLEVLRRNRNFKILRNAKPGLFVKQIQHWETQAQTTLRREAACCSLIVNTPEMKGAADLVPKLQSYDPVRHVLVTELLPGFEAVSERHLRLQSFPLAIADAMGRALATIHHESKSALPKLEQSGTFQKTVPWILSVHQQQPAWFTSLSAANSQLLELVKKYPGWHADLDKVRQEWKCSALMHGDMKWDNCLIFDENSKGGMRIKIVDWELADLGDPLWDVGAILQSYISHWILSMPQIPNLSPEELMERATVRLESVQPAVQVFWASYKQSIGPEIGDRKAALRRAVRYAAARMIQTAYESLSFSVQMNQASLYLLQVSMNILRDVDDAACELFGLAEV